MYDSLAHVIAVRIITQHTRDFSMHRCRHSQDLYYISVVDLYKNYLHGMSFVNKPIHLVRHSYKIGVIMNFDAMKITFGYNFYWSPLGTKFNWNSSRRFVNETCWLTDANHLSYVYFISYRYLTCDTNCELLSRCLGRGLRSVQSVDRLTSLLSCWFTFEMKFCV